MCVCTVAFHISLPAIFLCLCVGACTHPFIIRSLAISGSVVCQREQTDLERLDRLEWDEQHDHLLSSLPYSPSNSLSHIVISKHREREVKIYWASTYASSLPNLTFILYWILFILYYSMFFFAIPWWFFRENVSSVLKYFDQPMCDQFGKVFSDHDQIKQTNQKE